MDEIDKKILNLIQEEFPLSERPFEDIGKKTGISGREALKRVKELKEKGIIRRIGPILERKKLGYTSVLCGVHVDDSAIVEVAREISALAGVTHNYEREGELNLWFTITKKTIGEIDSALADLERAHGLRIYRFPEKRTFKIKTYFPL
ncbi:MAG TPA: Lrp/AsnC family transcriptional regulator [Syntrophorhabdaceae bacterium]|nr:Lrp/AsnC family transcriptional regulator [Syntrophorhabdaceae bacterium]HQM80660.1 Lrp/AsnC family transcriptional regulator [Syntrophorhabdaceae bacterium]